MNASPEQSEPRPLPADHPLMVEMAEVQVIRERRRLHWVGLGNALGEEWEDSTTFHRQSWQEEERIADKKYAELAGQIMLAERDYPHTGASQVSDIGQHEPKLRTAFDDKGISHRSTGNQPYHNYAKPMEVETWTEEKKSSAVDKWMEDMGATAPHTRVESLFIGGSDSNDRTMSPQRVEDWIEQGAVGFVTGPNHSLDTDSFLSERLRAKPEAPPNLIESRINDGVRRIWTREHEVAYEEAEAEREKQRLEANALSDNTAEDTAVFEEAEAEREEQRLHASSDLDTESKIVVLPATDFRSINQSAAHDSESRHELHAAFSPNITKPNVGLNDECLADNYVKPTLAPRTETHIIERPSNLEFVNDRHIAGPSAIIPAGYVQNAQAPSDVLLEKELEGTQAGRDMLQPNTLLAEQQALAMAAFRGLREQGLIGISEAANRPEASGVDLRPNNTMRIEAVPLLKDPVTDLELQTSRLEGMTVATDRTSRASTELALEQAKWMDIDDVAVEVVNLQDAPDLDTEHDSSNYTVPGYAREAKKFSRSRTRLASVQSVQGSSVSASQSETAKPARLISGSDDGGDLYNSKSDSDYTIGYERESEVRQRKKPRPALERSKSASATNKRRLQSKIWMLENKLRKIGKYKARREAGKEISFAHTRMINREEDIILNLEDLRA